ncbi:hypothetical protein Esi_0155_0021 [Ectocarpus siliculosus]|uniref:Uncharacterized protein n=1 Tax=Ectocarpus siliculosus TaxID=2880 RepID=D8LFZ9_ECTSI|nr:hypothetical protein Esi_0155_0021 [Ectocarpus siliculosus]|eukprot:CBN78898.1 hypothetical protein Esi_0155_0021 [Ectocarpus siliculosus]
MVVLYDRAWLQDLRLHLLVLLLFVQINQAAGEDLFQYVVRLLSAFEQTVFEKACEKSATRRHRSSDGPREEDRGGGSPHGNAASKAEEVSDAMVTGFKDGLIDFEHLKQSIGTSYLNEQANGDADGALERLGYCVEIFERYPGVCRCMLQWCHLPHAAVAALAAIDDSRARELHNRLREAYNPSRPTASRPAPPSEEWQGLSAFCDDFQCRLFEAIVARKPLGAFSTPPDCTSNCEGLQQTHCKDEDCR